MTEIFTMTIDTENPNYEDVVEKFATGLTNYVYGTEVNIFDYFGHYISYIKRMLKMIADIFDKEVVEVDNDVADYFDKLVEECGYEFA